MTIGKRSSICVYIYIYSSTLNSCNRLKIKLQLTTFLYSISGDFFTNILHLRSTKIQNIKRFYEIFISNAFIKRAWIKKVNKCCQWFWFSGIKRSTVQNTAESKWSPGRWILLKWQSDEYMSEENSYSQDPLFLHNLC